MNIVLAILAISLGRVNSPAHQDAPIKLPLVESNWTPPQKTTIPSAYIQATKALLGNGLADPRGGTFRKVTVLLSNASWQTETVKERQGFGWVLPNNEVVLVDGVKYPLKADLAPANPTDVILHGTGSIPFFSQDGIIIDGPTRALPALLLARGETDIAEKCFEITESNSINPVLDFYVELMGRYKMQVAQCLIDHKDNEAKQWATQLAMVSEIREKAGVNYDRHLYGPEWTLTTEEPRLILADLIRRVDHPKPRFDLAANAKLDQKARIKNLIEALDEVSAHQWGQPGGVSWQVEPIVQALYNEGEPAIPALLDTIEFDKRMTRSVSFGRDFFPARTIQSVRNAAHACLRAVWPSSESVRSEDPNLRIQKLRALWKTFEKLSESERWLNVLKDDKPEPESYKNAQLWALAAQHITDPAPVRHSEKSKGFNNEPSKKMQGESIRAKHGAEFSAFLTKRIEQITQVAESPNSFQFFEVANALTMAHCLAKWQGKSSLPVLRKASENALIMLRESFIKQRGVNISFVRPFALVIADRSKFGDASAAKDLVTVLPFFRSESFAIRDLLIPMWKCLNDSAIQTASKQYLSSLLPGKGSIDNRHVTFGLSQISEAIVTPLLLSPAYRSFLVDACAISKVVGTVTVTTQPNFSTISYKLEKDGGSGSMGVKAGTDLTGYLVTDQPLTAGDYFTQLLSQTEGCPPFLLSWPEDKKSAARKVIARWLMDKKVDWRSIAKSNMISYID